MSTIIFANRKGQTKKNSRDDRKRTGTARNRPVAEALENRIETSFAYRSPRGGKINIDLRGCK